MTTSAVVLTRTSTALAQNADAESLFREAVRFEAEGKVPEACTAFETSNRIEPRAGTLIRLGQCREKQGRKASAWSAYKDSLSRVKDPRKKKLAEERIAALEPTLSYLTVSVPDPGGDGLVVTRNGSTLEPILWNRAVPVDAGAYVIAGNAPGHEAWQITIDVGPVGDRASVEVPHLKAIKALVVEPLSGPSIKEPIEEPKPRPVDSPSMASVEEPHLKAIKAPSDPSPGSSIIKQPMEELEPHPVDSPSILTGKRKLALGLVGVGLAAVAGGVVLGVQAKGFENHAFALCPDPAACRDSAHAQDLADRGAEHAMYANIAYGVGAATVVGAAILWFTGAPLQDDRVAVTPKLGSSFTGMTVHLGF